MNDFAFVGIIIAFFAVAPLLVRGCERIIGPDPGAVAAPAQEPSLQEHEEAAA